MFPRFRNSLMIATLLAPVLAGCGTSNTNSTAAGGGTDRAGATAAVESPCSKVWPAYWQDPAFDKQGMWAGQTVSDTPAAQKWDPSNPAYTNPPFELADAYDKGRPEDPATHPWTDAKYDALFKPDTPQAQKTQLAHDYGWAVMHYIQEGNIDSGDVNTDWNLCANKVRQWFNMPFQTYDVLQGREFIHGLTREAPVTFSVAAQAAPLGTTVWAVGFYNGNAAPTLASVWRSDGTVTQPAADLKFADGTVVGKLLFTTATTTDLPFLENVPSWTGNLSWGNGGSNNTYCGAKGTGGKPATMPQQSQQCPRSPRKVTLLQFDIAVRDPRATMGWVFGTFTADGQAKASEKNPWNRISLLGLIWGNDTPPTGQLASTFPADPKANGFADGVIDWDLAARLNKAGGSNVSGQPGHLGCNSRLNGPADNVNSSCVSCHMTASRPDSNNKTPAILSQFGNFTAPGGQTSALTPQCAAPNADPKLQMQNVTFAQMDGIYFANTHCASPFQDKVNGVCIYGPNIPTYADKRPNWISTDFSLQMSGALVEWNEWQGDLAKDKAAASKPALKATKTPDRVFTSEIPERGE